MSQNQQGKASAVNIVKKLLGQETLVKSKSTRWTSHT